MAYICKRDLKCDKCEHFRYDDDRGEKVCWAKYDEEVMETFEELIENVDVILDYEDFRVIHNNKNHRYFYIEKGEDYKQVALLATLSPSNSLSESVDDAVLASMYDCTCSGEHIDSEGNCTYMWFREL